MSQLWRRFGAGFERSDLDYLTTLKEEWMINYLNYQLMALCHLLLSRLPALSHVFKVNGANAETFGKKPRQLST